MTVSVSMIADDRAQISQAHVQDSLCLCCCKKLRVLKHFVDVHYYFVLVFVRFLLYVVYVFALCSPYLEDNKVSIYLSIYLSFETLYVFWSWSADVHMVWI